MKALALLRRALYANLVVVDLLFQCVSIDTEQLRRFDLISVARNQCKFDEGFLYLFEDDVIKSRQFDIRIALLLKEHLKLALDELFEAHSLEVCNEEIV